MKCSKLSISPLYDSADNQCSLTANTSTANVAIRNSGVATSASVLRLIMRSSSEPRFTAARMPIEIAIGTETSVVIAASSSAFRTRAGSHVPDRHTGGARHPEAAAHEAGKPMQITQVSRLIEAELQPQGRNR